MIKNLKIKIIILTSVFCTKLFAPSIQIPQILLEQNFSWVLKNRLGGMACPQDKNIIDALNSINVGLLVSLIEKPLPSDWFQNTQMKLKNIHIPVPDFGTPTVEQVDSFIKEAQKTLNLKKAVVVHCGAGFGRTGTMLACFLTAKRNFLPEQAIKFVRKIRPGSIETEDQMKFIGLYNYYSFIQKIEEEKQAKLLLKQLKISLTNFKNTLIELKIRLQALYEKLNLLQQQLLNLKQ